MINLPYFHWPKTVVSLTKPAVPFGAVLPGNSINRVFLIVTHGETLPGKLACRTGFWQ